MIKFTVSKCCDVIVDVPDFDEEDEYAPQNYGICQCPECGKTTEIVEEFY